MKEISEAQDGTYQPFNDAVRLALLDKLPAMYAAEPERHERAVAQTEGLSHSVRENLPGVEEGTPDGELLEAALTKIFFAFSNPEQPEDTPSADQMAHLCADTFYTETSKLSFAEKLDTAASYLVAYSNDIFLGPRQPGVSSSERFDAALEQLYLGFESE